MSTRSYTAHIHSFVLGSYIGCFCRTGRRPDTSRVWTIGPYFRDTTGANWVTLPQFFKQHGYVTAGAGKLFHHGGPSGYLENRSTTPPTVIRDGDDYPHSVSALVLSRRMPRSFAHTRCLARMQWTMPYTQNGDSGKADGQYPTPGGVPKYNASRGWSNRG